LQPDEIFSWHTFSPIVKFVAKVYQTGVALSQKAKTALESRIQRLPGLGKWFVRIALLSLRC
jgi:hypothetical protein